MNITFNKWKIRLVLILLPLKRKNKKKIAFFLLETTNAFNVISKASYLLHFILLSVFQSFAYNTLYQRLVGFLTFKF